MGSSHCSLSMLFMMKVMVCCCVSHSHEGYDLQLNLIMLPSKSCCGAAFFLKVFNNIEWVVLIKTVLVDLSQYCKC